MKKWIYVYAARNRCLSSVVVYTYLRRKVIFYIIVYYILREIAAMKFLIVTDFEYDNEYKCG